MVSTSEIVEYYQRSIQAIEGIDRNPGDFQSFLGLTRDEAAAALAEMRRELDQEVILFLFASFEAIIRGDFEARVDKRKKDAVSVSFRRMKKERSGFTPLEDILDIWKKERPEFKAVIGHAKQQLKYRHWLAHGRLGAQLSGVNPLPEDILRVGKQLIDALGLS